MTAWSYTALKREHGEEKALLMLADMKGMGQYERPVKGEPRSTRSAGNCILCGVALSVNKRCGL